MTVNGKKIFMMAGLGILVFIGMKYLLIPVIPFLLGWILACWILPVAKWFERRLHIKRGIAGGILVGAAVVGIGMGIWSLGTRLLNQVSSLTEWISGWGLRKEDIFHQCCQTVERYMGMEQGKVYEFLVLQEKKLGQNFQDKISTQGMDYLVSFGKNTILVISSILVVIIFAVLLIKDMESLQEKIQEITFTRIVWQIGRNIGKAGGKYIKAQGEIMLIVAVVCALGLWILGNPHFLVWGILIGILDALPVLGVGIILLPWAVIWFLRGKYWLALGYLILFLVADLVRQFLEPKILGKEIGLHPALMLISVYGGIFLYGVSGFVLGPITVLIFLNIWKELDGKIEKS